MLKSRAERSALGVASYMPVVDLGLNFTTSKNLTSEAHSFADIYLVMVTFECFYVLILLEFVREFVTSRGEI